MKRYAAIFLLALAACKKDHQEPGPDLSVDPTLLDNAPAEVVFISRRIDNSADWQLYIMNMDGTNQRLLSDRIVQCAPVTASHDGQQITFTTYENFKKQLYVLNKTTGARILLATNDEYISNAAWSPDDSKILFVKMKDKSAHAITYSICIVDSDGNNPKELVANKSVGAPQWFPDGKSIAYIEAENGKAVIYSMRPDGSDKKRLSPAGQSFGQFSISPTGEQMVLVSNSREGSQLFLMNAKGGAVRQVTTSVSPRVWPGWPRDGNNSPVWSPDGSKIAYVSWANETPDIFIMDANGKNDRRLTNGAIRDESPQWSRDGKYIYFNSNRDMSLNHEIYRMTPDGKNQTPLNQWMADDVYPVIIKK